MLRFFCGAHFFVGHLKSATFAPAPSWPGAPFQGAGCLCHKYAAIHKLAVGTRLTPRPGPNYNKLFAQPTTHELATVKKRKKRTKKTREQKRGKKQ